MSRTEDPTRPSLEAVRELARSRRPLMRAFVAITILLVLASIAVTVSRLSLGHDRLLGFATFLDLDVERSLPTWFEGSLFLFGALVCGLVAWIEWREQPRRGRYWAVMMAALLFMSLDEHTGIHERLTIPERFLGPYESIGFVTWIFLGALLMAAVAGLLMRFVLSLPPGTRNGILLAGALFLTGSVGLEAIGGLWALDHGEQGYGYALFTTVEESLELAGVLVLLDALLAHLAGVTTAP